MQLDVDHAIGRSINQRIIQETSAGQASTFLWKIWPMISLSKMA